MNILDNIRLKAKLIFVLSISIIGLIILSITSFISQNSIKLNYEVINSIDALQVQELELRKHEKDFLLREDPKYRDAFLKTKEDLVNVLNAAKKVDTKNLLSVDLEKYINNYSEEFMKIYENKNKIGFSSNEGLMGEMRNSIHTIEGEFKAFDTLNLSNSMLLLRRHEKDFIIRKDKKYIEEFNSEYTIFYKNINNSSKFPPEIKKKLNLQAENYKAKFFELTDLEISCGLDSNSGLLGEMRNNIHEFEKLLTSGKLNAQKIIIQEEKLNKLLSIGYIVVISLFVFFLVFLIIRNINLKMRNIVEFLSGDINNLTRKLSISGKDEFAEIGLYINKFIENLHGVVSLISINSSNLASMSTELASAVTEVDATIQEISNSSVNTRESVDSTSSAITQMAASLNQLSGNIKSMTNFFKGITEATHTGAEAVNESIHSMDRIKSSSESIYNIVNVITEIAGQTNLLSLNAAIEAAKAGEHGKGFAVVAEEVRKLAERSANAAKEITELISNSTKQVELGSSIIETAGNSLDNILSKVEETSNLVLEINAAADEQSKGVQEIVTSSDNISSLSEQNASATTEISATMEEIRKTVEELSSLSFNLNVKVEEFIL